MKQLKYQPSTINANFRIKLYGQGIDKLVGVTGFIQAVDDIDLMNRLLDRAFNNRLDKVVCKLRRGLKVTFYYK